MLHLSLYSARHLPTAAVLLLPLSIGALTREADRRVRAEVASAVGEVNALIRQHNLQVTTAALHLRTVSADELLEIARTRR